MEEKSLKQAAVNDDAGLVKKLIAEGADINDTEGSSFGSALNTAARNGNLEIARLLIEAGADINLKNEDMGATPLMMAADSGKPDMVDYLISQNADLNATNYDGATALMYARYTKPDVRDRIVSAITAAGGR